MGPDLKLISWNLLHTTGAGADQVEALIRDAAPDLMVMQEAGVKLDVLPERLGGHYARTPLPGRPHGLAAWSREPFDAATRSLPLQRGLIVRRVCQIIDFESFSVANVHLSHGQILNRRQLRRIAATLPPAAIIAGDCNMVGAPLLPGFADAGAPRATHRMSGLLPLRLDRCFIRGFTCSAAEILPRGGSDHHPLWLVLQRGG